MAKSRSPKKLQSTKKSVSKVSRKVSRKVKKASRKASRKVSRKALRKASRKVSRKVKKTSRKVSTGRRSKVSSKTLTKKEQDRITLFSSEFDHIKKEANKFFKPDWEYNPFKNTISGKTSAKNLSELLEKKVDSTRKDIIVTFSLDSQDRFKVTYSNYDIPVKRNLIPLGTHNEMVIKIGNLLIGNK